MYYCDDETKKNIKIFQEGIKNKILEGIGCDLKNVQINKIYMIHDIKYYVYSYNNRDILSIPEYYCDYFEPHVSLCRINNNINLIDQSILECNKNLNDIQINYKREAYIRFKNK